MVQRVGQKVVREMAEIRCVVEFRTNLQLVVLKILSVASCEEGGFDGFDLLRKVFFELGREDCTVVDVLWCREWGRKWFEKCLKFGAL